jgi:membrane protein implicated in regulation of membrane protease activity
MSDFMDGDLAVWLQNVEFWHWWVLGVALIAIEVFAPSTVLLWPGIAAFVVGVLILLGIDMMWQVQIAVFAFLSVTSLFAWRAYDRTRPAKTDDSGLNRRGSQCVGRTYTLAEAIVDGRGTLQAEGTIWKITGPDLAIGARVTVAAVERATLRVEEAQ